MEDSPTPLIRRPGEGECWFVAGDHYRFLADASETGGHYALWEATIPPGGGPPLHRHHREEEAFYVLTGQVTIAGETEQVEVGPGTFIHLPRGSKHRFSNAGQTTARMLILVSPGGMEGMFREVGQRATASAAEIPPISAEQIDKLLETAPRYGLEIFPPPPPEENVDAS